MKTFRHASFSLSLMTSLLASVFTAGADSSSADVVFVKDKSFPTTATLAGSRFTLLGADLLTYWGFEVYTAAFYVGQRKQGTDDVLDASVPKKLVLSYHRKIDRKDIIETTRKYVQENPENDYNALRERLEKAYGFYETVRKGDQYTVVYTPGEGTAFFFNGEKRGAVKGGDFARAFFGIWVSEDPVSSELRKALLGRT